MVGLSTRGNALVLSALMHGVGITLAGGVPGSEWEPSFGDVFPLLRSLKSRLLELETVCVMPCNTLNNTSCYFHVKLR